MIMPVLPDMWNLGEIEGVSDGEFPTVDSEPTVCDAFTRSKMSSLTTSLYAHDGTEVPELIFFGYLS
jgi:hypothetical protein